MFRQRDLRVILWAGVLGLSLAAPSVADAAFVLTLDDVGFAGIEVIIADNAGIGVPTAKGLTTAIDLASDPGVIVFYGVVGGFTTQLNSALSKPLAGNSTSMSRMDLQNTSTTGVGTLEIMVTDTDFELLSGHSVGLAQRITGEDVGGSVALLDGMLDEGNMEFGIAGGPIRSLGPLGPFASAPFGDESSMTGPPLAGPFSLSQHVRIVHSSPDQVSQFATTIKATTLPEPSTMLTFGLLAGVGMMTVSRGRNRRRG